jgi:acyl dehydratase
MIRTLTQGDFDDFAALSGDNNAIHVDAAFAASSRFGRTVAHGLLLVAILQGLAETLVAKDARLAEKAVQFPAPSYADEPLRFTAHRTDADEVTAIEARRLADDTVTCIGTLRFISGTA